MHARYAEREAQRGRECIGGIEEVELQLLQAIPILARVVARGDAGLHPDRIGDRTLRDDAQTALSRERQHARDRFLIRDADGNLQRIERAALERADRIVAVAAISDEASLARPLRILDRADDIALAQPDFRTAMQLEQVDMIGAQVLEALIDALRDEARVPFVEAQMV